MSAFASDASSDDSETQRRNLAKDVDPIKEMEAKVLNLRRSIHNARARNEMLSEAELMYRELGLNLGSHWLVDGPLPEVKGVNVTVASADGVAGLSGLFCVCTLIGDEHMPRARHTTTTVPAGQGDCYGSVVWDLQDSFPEFVTGDAIEFTLWEVRGERWDSPLPVIRNSMHTDSGKEGAGVGQESDTLDEDADDGTVARFSVAYASPPHLIGQCCLTTEAMMHDGFLEFKGIVKFLNLGDPRPEESYLVVAIEAQESTRVSPLIDHSCSRKLISEDRIAGLTAIARSTSRIFEPERLSPSQLFQRKTEAAVDARKCSPRSGFSASSDERLPAPADDEEPYSGAGERAPESEPPTLTGEAEDEVHYCPQSEAPPTQTSEDQGEVQNPESEPPPTQTGEGEPVHFGCVVNVSPRGTGRDEVSSQSQFETLSTGSGGGSLTDIPSEGEREVIRTASANQSREPRSLPCLSRGPVNALDASAQAPGDFAAAVRRQFEQPPPQSLSQPNSARSSSSSRVVQPCLSRASADAHAVAPETLNTEELVQQARHMEAHLTQLKEEREQKRLRQRQILVEAPLVLCDQLGQGFLSEPGSSQTTQTEDVRDVPTEVDAMQREVLSLSRKLEEQKNIAECLMHDRDWLRASYADTHVDAVSTAGIHVPPFRRVASL